MIDVNNYQNVLTVFGGAAASFLSVIYGLRKMIRHWEKEGLEIQKINTEESLIKSLRSESERMALQNQRLMEQLSSLQLQIGELHQAITKLRSENDALHRQIETLNQEIKVIKI